MGVLSSNAIRSRLAEPDLERRLVLSPLLEPDEQIRDHQACVDIKLGTEFRISIPALSGVVDTLESGRSADECRYESMYVPLGTSIVAHPHQLILGQSIEYMRFPSDLAGYVVGRSSWGRLGLVVATAVGIHPLFSGVLTLEIRNLGELPLRLYPGDTIAQLFLHDVTDPVAFEPSRGQFHGATSPKLGRLRYSTTETKLRRLAELHRARSRRT